MQLFFIMTHIFWTVCAVVFLYYYDEHILDGMCCCVLYNDKYILGQKRNAPYNIKNITCKMRVTKLYVLSMFCSYFCHTLFPLFY